MAVRLGWVALAVVPFVAGYGCGTQANKAVKVSGIVTLDGEPLVGAKVTFYPASGEAPPMGITDRAGRFQLSTFDLKTRTSTEGALPGEYKVTVMLPRPAGRNPGSSGGEDLKTGHMRKPKPAGKKGAVPPSEPKVLHANYADMAKTPLTQVVPPQGRVELKLTKNGT
jgi:hypothetical protein